MKKQIFIAVLSLIAVISSCNKEIESKINPPKPSSINYGYYQDQVLLKQAWDSGVPESRNAELGVYTIDSVFFNSADDLDVDTDTLEISIDNLGKVSINQDNNLPIGSYMLGISVENDNGRYYNNRALVFDVVDLEAPEITLDNSVNNHFMIELNGDGSIKGELTQVPGLKVQVSRADLNDIVITRPGDRYYYSVVDGSDSYGVVNFVEPLVLGEKDTIRFNINNVAGSAEEKFVVVEAFVPMPTIHVAFDNVTEPVPVLIDEEGNTLYSSVQGVKLTWENMSFEDMVVTPSDKFILSKMIDEVTNEEYALLETVGKFNQETIIANINATTLAGDAEEQSISLEFKLDDTPVEVRNIYTLDTPSLTLGKLNGVLEAEFNSLESYYIKGLLEGQDIAANVWVMEVSNDASNASPDPQPVIRYYAEKLNRKTGNQSEYALISPSISIVDAREITIETGTYFDQYSTKVIDDAQRIEYNIISEDQYNTFINIPISDEAARESAASTWTVLKSFNGGETADYSKDISGKTAKYWDTTLKLKINDIELIEGDNIRVVVHIINSRESAKNSGKTGVDKLIVTGKYKI